MEILLELLGNFFNSFIFYFAMTVCGSYILLTIFSGYEMVFYKKKNAFVNYESILSSPLAPSISIIAPAYNEENSVVENARSLLSLYYNNFEVIIVNDGSKDNSVARLVEHYELELVDFAINYIIPCKNIRGVYKSKNKAFSKLVVVDKENGGKADSLNAGINISKNSIIACIDVDCILEHDSLLKMVKPFLEEKTKVIATGGVIRIANSCEIADGRVIKIHLPKNLLARMQVLEYFRAFLMGRMAWSKLNGLMLVSGALGFFDKQIAIECGGYSHTTVGEDMELVVRMRKYMADNKRPCKVVYVPDPLCWTEAPSSLKILARQRNRWMRGTIETLLTHESIFFNPKYGLLGLLSYPYWFLFEWMSPLIEFGGICFVIIMGFLGMVSMEYFITLLIVVFSFAFMLSSFAILYEELSYHQYRNKKDLYKLMAMAIVEPIIYHPMVLLWAIQGNIDFVMGKNSWGEMTRTGFKKPTG